MAMKRYIPIIITSLLLLGACEEEIKFTGSYDGEKLVLRSEAVAGEFVFADLEKSHFFLDSNSSYDSRAISGAAITLTVDGKDYPFDEIPMGDGDVSYVCSYVVKEGDNLHISAKSDAVSSANGVVSADTYVPAKPSFEVKSWEIVHSSDIITGEDTVLKINVVLNDPAGVKNYYCANAYLIDDSITGEVGDDYFYFDGVLYANDVAFVDINGVDIMSSGALGYFDDSIFEGTSYSFSLYCRWNDNFSPADNLTLNMISMSDDLYKYSVTLEDARNSLDIFNMFGEPVSIYNNIIGGIGFFGGCAVSSITLE